MMNKVVYIKRCESQKRHLMLHTGKHDKQLSQCTPECKSISESTILTWLDLTYTNLAYLQLSLCRMTM